MTSAASTSWVILGSVPRVAAADGNLSPGADLSLELPAPPRVALLTIPPRIFPGRAASDNFPTVVSVDPSGLLLLRANQGRATRPTVVDTPSHQQFGWRPFVPGYFVLDAKSDSTLPLPNPEYILHVGHLGLIVSPGDAGHYMVAELQPYLDGGKAVLMRFSSEAGEWVSKEIGYPLPDRQLYPNGVVSHSGRLWWVDLSWCLLTCNPFADAPVLSSVQLPQGKAFRLCGGQDLQGQDKWVLKDYRFAGFKQGELNNAMETLDNNIFFHRAAYYRVAHEVENKKARHECGLEVMKLLVCRNGNEKHDWI